jgi:hypothetical protein
MSKKTVLSLAVLIIPPLIIYFLWPSDESRIKKLFREGSQAIEQEKTEDVMAEVSFNYTDDHGLTYLLIKEGMERVFRLMSDIKIEYEIENISVKDTTATADLDIRIIARSGQDTGYVVGDVAKPAHMRFFLEKERATWLVSKTEGISLFLE